VGKELTLPYGGIYFLFFYFSVFVFWLALADDGSEVTTTMDRGLHGERRRSCNAHAVRATTTNTTSPPCPKDTSSGGE